MPIPTPTDGRPRRRSSRPTSTRSVRPPSRATVPRRRPPRRRPRRPRQPRRRRRCNARLECASSTAIAASASANRSVGGADQAHASTADAAGCSRRCAGARRPLGDREGRLLLSARPSVFEPMAAGRRPATVELRAVGACASAAACSAVLWARECVGPTGSDDDLEPRGGPRSRRRRRRLLVLCASGACDDTCRSPTTRSDDGGAVAEYSYCTLGSDCADCAAAKGGVNGSLAAAPARIACAAAGQRQVRSAPARSLPPGRRASRATSSARLGSSRSSSRKTVALGAPRPCAGDRVRLRRATPSTAAGGAARRPVRGAGGGRRRRRAAFSRFRGRCVRGAVGGAPLFGCGGSAASVALRRRRRRRAARRRPRVHGRRRPRRRSCSCAFPARRRHGLVRSVRGRAHPASPCHRPHRRRAARARARASRARARDATTNGRAHDILPRLCGGHDGGFFAAGDYWVLVRLSTGHAGAGRRDRRRQNRVSCDGARAAALGRSTAPPIARRARPRRTVGGALPGREPHRHRRRLPHGRVRRVGPIRPRRDATAAALGDEGPAAQLNCRRCRSSPQCSCSPPPPLAARAGKRAGTSLV